MGDLFEVDPTEIFRLAILDVKNKPQRNSPKKKLKDN